MDIEEFGYEVVDWVHVIQYRNQWRALVNMVINFWVPLKAVDLLNSRGTISFSRKNSAPSS
jgi:hypothetical protein